MIRTTRSTGPPFVMFAIAAVVLMTGVAMASPSESTNKTVLMGEQDNDFIHQQGLFMRTQHRNTDQVLMERGVLMEQDQDAVEGYQPPGYIHKEQEVAPDNGGKFEGEQSLMIFKPATLAINFCVKSVETVVFEMGLQPAHYLVLTMINHRPSEMTIWRQVPSGSLGLIFEIAPLASMVRQTDVVGTDLALKIAVAPAEQYALAIVARSTESDMYLGTGTSWIPRAPPTEEMTDVVEVARVDTNTG